MTPEHENSKADSNSRSYLAALIDTSRPYDIEGVPLWLYSLLVVFTVFVIQLNLLKQTGIAGAYGVLWTIGLFFFAVGERIRILKLLLGGGLIIAYAGAAVVAYNGLVSENQIAQLQSHLIGNRLLYFLLGALVIASILSVPVSVLKRSLLSYGPIILSGLVFSGACGIFAGLIAGVPIDHVVTKLFLPIMGGGTGAGAIPMSEVYADVTGEQVSAYFNYAIGVLTLGNIAAILVASLLSQVARILPSLSGNGVLLRGGEKIDDVFTIPEGGGNSTHAAMVLTVVILLAGVLLAEVIGMIHFFAWVTIIAICLNIFQMVPLEMRLSLRKLSAWGMKAFLVTILVAFGLSADFAVIAAILTPANLLVIFAVVIGAAFGAGLMAYFVNCYPIEGALCGGLCMANAGGSGDLQVLGAARRLPLYPYAQISSRLGGAFVLILANYLFGLFA